MEIEGIFFPACITVFSLGLFIVSILSYRKHKNKKLIFVSVVFFVFLIRGILLSLMSLNLLFAEAVSFLSSPYNGLFDLTVLLLLFIATLKR